MSEPALAAAPQEQEVDRIAREIGIPPCPAILSRFATEMQRDAPDTRKLAALIGADIALSAALLKLVNSPFYGLRTKASNAHQALSIVGLRAGANLVTGLILRRSFPVASGALMQRFWDGAERVAATAVALARQLRGIDPHEAHTYALFRDSGMSVMINKFRDYATSYDRFEHMPGANATALEQARYRYSHARVGYALARGWLLPEPLCRAILFHHEFDHVSAGRRDVEPANRSLVAFGLLVDQVIALRRGAGLCPDWSAGERFVLDSFAITPEQIIAFARADPADLE